MSSPLLLHRSLCLSPIWAPLFVASLGLSSGCPTSDGPNEPESDAGAAAADGGIGAADAGILDDSDGGAGEVDGGNQDAGAEVDAGANADAGSLPAFECGPVPSGVAEGHLGSTADVRLDATRRIVLMGGSAEVDSATEQFVNAANGGDVLTLRATGSVDSYTPYFYDELSYDPAPNSSATFRFDVASASADDAVQCRVAAAEAIWFAGGDQWDYLDAWDATTLAAAAAARSPAIGGTSAGAMILSEFSFAAELGGVTSEEALADPSASDLVPISSAYGQHEMARTVVDTHFTERDREGRLLVFAAHARAQSGSTVFGIGLDERAALVVNEDAFLVLTGAQDRSVWVYVVDAAPTIGATLSVENVRRYRLSSGASGAWPFTEDADSLGAFTAVTLDVTESIVSER